MLKKQETGGGEERKKTVLAIIIWKKGQKQLSKKRTACFMIGKTKGF